MARAKTTPEPTPEWAEKATAFGKQTVKIFNDKIKPNWKPLTGAAVLLAVVLIAVSSARASRLQKEQEGFAALRAAESDIPALSDVISTYAGTPAGVQARFRKADALMSEEKFDEAATQFKLLQEGAVDPDLLASARLGEAYAIECGGDAATAEKRFAAVPNGGAPAYVAVEALMGAGRCAQTQGKLAEATKWFDRAAARAKGAELDRQRQQAKDTVTRIDVLSNSKAPPAPAEDDAPAEPADGSADDAPGAGADTGTAPEPSGDAGEEAGE